MHSHISNILALCITDHTSFLCQTGNALSLYLGLKKIEKRNKGWLQRSQKLNNSFIFQFLGNKNSVLNFAYFGETQQYNFNILISLKLLDFKQQWFEHISVQIIIIRVPLNFKGIEVWRSGHLSGCLCSSFVFRSSKYHGCSFKP